MNRFDQIIQELADKTSEPAMDDLRPAARPPMESDEPQVEHQFRLPYSSNPKPIERRWSK